MRDLMCAFYDVIGSVREAGTNVATGKIGI